MNKPPLIYVAGPMTNDPLGCVRNALPAYHALRNIGCAPFLPQFTIVHEIIEHVDYEDALAYDFDIIRNCAAILRLPGVSPGADREMEYGAGIGVWSFHDVENLHIWLKGAGHLI